MTIYELVRLRAADASDEDIENCIETVTDRLNLRLGTTELPAAFNTICADAAIKMWRRTYFEGIEKESISGISDQFVDDILKEYENEIRAWKNSESNTSGSKRVVHFI